ncbi:MAG: ABC transporter substrate-binding protein [Burkholderiales bacterium]|nr:ABC transporter substrate-binding protein [Burkholderiales bacterium]
MKLDQPFRLITSVALAMGLGASIAANAADAPGVSATEIKIGQTAALSGPAAAYGLLARANTAFFKMINDQGGINGRKINLVTADDEYVPNKSFEAVRKLVEQDKVAFMYASFGTPSNSAQAPYLNREGVPHLFLGTGADKWGDQKTLPWSMGFQPSFRQEARIYTKHILTNDFAAKIGVLYQNDDFGRDYLKGVQDVLGKLQADKLVKAVSYETSDATVDSQIVSLQAAGAHVIVLAAIPKFAGQAIRKAHAINWRPTMYVASGAADQPATTDAAKERSGIILFTGQFGKDPKDAVWDKDPGMVAYRDFMKKYMPSEDATNPLPVLAFNTGNLLVRVLKQAGNDLSRQNIMKQAESLKNVPLPLLLPDVRVNTAKDDHYPVDQMRLGRFNGSRWAPIGEVISTSDQPWRVSN